MLYWYGIKVGAKLLLHRRVQPALRLLIAPVNYWRDVEYQLVWDAANFRATDRILDIGSPKLLSLFLAKRLGATVIATDIEDYFVDTYRLLGKCERLSSNRFRVCVEDGRKLSFANGSFSKTYAISVVEHIPEDGDTQCVQEMARVLAKGGRCLITVPFAPVSRVDYQDANFYWAGSSQPGDDGRVFFQRRYSEEDLYSRLITPSGMRVLKIAYVGDKVLAGSQKEVSDYLHPLLGPLHPLLSQLLHTAPTSSWGKLKKPLCALIVLEK